MLPLSTIIHMYSSTAYSSTLRLDFDGVDEYLLISAPSFAADTKTGGRTLSMRVQIDNFPAANAMLFSVRDGSTSTYSGLWNLRLYSTGGNWYFALQRRVENGSSFSPAGIIYNSTALSTGTKYMVTISTNGTGHKIHVNGASATSDTGDSGDWWGDSVFGFPPTLATVGATAAPAVFLDGKVDEITYWNKQLTNTEVAELYNSGAPLDPTTHSASANLDGWWKMGEDMGGSITTVYDSVNSDDFTSVNMENGDIVSVSYP